MRSARAASWMSLSESATSALSAAFRLSRNVAIIRVDVGQHDLDRDRERRLGDARRRIASGGQDGQADQLPGRASRLITSSSA